MNDEQFQAYLEVLLGPGDGSAHAGGIDRIPREKHPEVLDASLIRLPSRTSRLSDRAMQAARLLMREGVCPGEEAILEMVSKQVAARPSSSFLFPSELVAWVERTVSAGTLSFRALTELRRLPEALLKGICNREQREVIDRLSMALGLKDAGVISRPVDGWTAMALKWREALPTESQGRWDKLLELANGQQSAKPSKTYLAKGQALAGSIPEFSRMMEALLRSIGRDGPVGVRFRGHPSSRKDLLDEDYTSLLRALIWLCGPYPELRTDLQEAAQRAITKIRGVGPLSAKVVAGCGFALSQQEDDSAVRAVFTLQTGAKHKSTQRAMRNAVAKIETRTGTPAHILEESVVPAFGFPAGPQPSQVIGGETVFLTCTPACAPVLLIEPQTTAAGGKKHIAPTAKGKDAKALLREIKKAWRHEVWRLERLMCDGRALTVEVWQERYLAHPLLGPLCRRLLWRVDDGLIAFAAPEMPEQWDEVVRLDGTSYSLPKEGAVRLWHPCELTEENRQAWERWVLDRRLIQPFQQALRAVYRPAAGDASSDARFAGELLQQATLYAVDRDRGWAFEMHENTLTYEPKPLPGRPVISAAVELGDPVRAPGDAEAITISLPIIDVTFRVDGSPVVLADVPPISFSEVMRDLDFFIAATRSAQAKS
ncbi:MAG: DUF4132 domain-containing protein [Chthoniobacteraceae bacterium]